MPSCTRQIFGLRVAAAAAAAVEQEQQQEQLLSLASGSGRGKVLAKFFAAGGGSRHKCSPNTAGAYFYQGRVGGVGGEI